jgi:hypothetical protein
MIFTRTIYLASALALVSAGAARADVIPGPILNNDDSGWIYSGVGFQALVNTSLTSFTFQNQGNADTVELVDPFGNILDSIGIPAGIPSDTVSVNWALTAGSQYYLLQSTQNNSLWTNWGLPAPSDGQIAITDTGDFSYFPVSADFGIGGGGGGGTDYWGAFNNITTGAASASAPEPASLILLLPIAGAGLWFARRRGLIRAR